MHMLDVRIHARLRSVCRPPHFRRIYRTYYAVLIKMGRLPYNTRTNGPKLPYFTSLHGMLCGARLRPDAVESRNSEGWHGIMAPWHASMKKRHSGWGCERRGRGWYA
jgi:hypothetical protein